MEVTRDAERPVLAHMRKAVEALVSGQGDIRARLIEAEPHFGRVCESGELRGDAEGHLELRIGAGLVEGGDDESDDGPVAACIAALDVARAAEIAADMFMLYELLAGLRRDRHWATLAR